MKMVKKKQGIVLIVITSLTLIFGCYHSRRNRDRHKQGGLKTMESKQKKPNNLINETSPYLLQHAYNPIDWYPWNKEALDKAKSENKPIFLSIGYAACHWCHVMEEESFTNQEIANQLNEKFVSIKVDREERPDLDQVYMQVVQMLTGNGGWPLSVFLTPDLKPFYGGTYFPPDNRYGIIGFRALIGLLSKEWQSNPHDLIKNSKTLTNSLERANEKEQDTTIELDETVFKRSLSIVKAYHDSQYGGFGSKPKFPQPMVLDFLMRLYLREKENQALAILTKTLDQMASGGIYDHVGGGFHRYATDERWLVPHFEKMLYDNALLSKVYVNAFALTGNTEYRNIAEDVYSFVLREMRGKSGGFYSTQDADSEGKEGLYYLWEYNTIFKLFDPKPAKLLCDYFTVKESGNFRSPEAYHAGLNVLHRQSSNELIANKYRLSLEELDKQIREFKETLYKERKKRVAPSTDDKIITAWNGLMISSLAQGHKILNNSEYLTAAIKAADHVINTMVVSGRLKRIYREGVVKQEGFLDDYAYTIAALIDLYESTFEVRWLEEAEKLTNIMIEDFWDVSRGGFFFAASFHNNLIVRAKSWNDAALPSENAIAAMNLFRLGKFLDKNEYIEKGERLIRLTAALIRENPFDNMSMLSAFDFYKGPVKEFAVVGPRENSKTEKMIQAIQTLYMPNKIVAFLSADKESHGKAFEKIPLLKGKTSSNLDPKVYICQNFTCKQPIENIKELQESLSE